MNLTPLPQQEEKNQFIWWSWFKNIGLFCTQLSKSLQKTATNEVAVSSDITDFVPTVTADDGTSITNYTTNYCSYTRTGRMVTFSGQVTVWTAGAAAGKGMRISLPVPSAKPCLVGTAREMAITGNMCQCFVFASLDDVDIYTYTNGPTVINGYVILFSVTYPTV